MISLYKKDFNKEKDFLIYNLGKINVIFSTAIDDRSFNRHKEFGIENLNSIVRDFIHFNITILFKTILNNSFWIRFI